MKNKKIILCLIGVLVLLGIIFFTFLRLHKKDKIVPTAEELKPTEYKRVKYENASEIVNYGTCVSKSEDETCYLVVDQAMLTLKNSKITKEEGDSTNLEETINNGLNSSIVVTYDSLAKIEQSQINTSAEGAIGIFVNGRKAKTEIYNTNINTLSNTSAGIAVSNSGAITGDHVTINTKVKNSPAILVSKNKGDIELSNSMLETNGAGSPIISTEGNAKLFDTTGTANGSRIAILKNNANVVLKNSSFRVSGGSNEEYSESGVLIYSDQKENNVVFQSINSSLNINQNLPYYKFAHFFIVDKTNAEIDLENTALNFGSNKFLKATNSNITINLKSQVIYGEIELENSKISLNMIDHSSYTGFINNNESTVYLSKDSELNLTGDTYIKELKNDNPTNSNIQLNGYHLYVNNELIK